MKIKRIRVLFALLFFIIILFCYHFGNTAGIIKYFQFMPAILSAIYEHSLFSAGFVFFVLILTLIFGRLYCSFLCPLGILQDIFSYFNLKRKYKYKNHSPLIRYAIPLLTLILLLFGINILLEYTEPFSFFGRIINLNHSIGITKKAGFTGIIISITVLILLFIISFISGRSYCNSLCPVGALLSIFAKFSFFKFNISENLCINCKQCVSVCKSSCIDINSMKIDQSKCVSCFNCISTCKLKAITYSSPNLKSKESAAISESKKNVSRRKFLELASISSIALIFAPFIKAYNKIPNIITPPGSKTVKRFLNSCTGCQSCVSKCPTGVLKISGFSNGFKAAGKPALDYDLESCDYNCTICSRVCPSGAIVPVTHEEKKRISIGEAIIDKSICVVYKNSTSCAACQEICPTGAVYTINYKNGLPAPVLDNTLCIGCGACQYACPTKPLKAINVTAKKTHTRTRAASIAQPTHKKSKEIDKFAF